MTIQFSDFRGFNNGVVKRTLSEDDAAALSSVFIERKSTHRALLLFHGFSSSPAVFRFLIPALGKTYDCIYAPTLPGHGETIDAFAKIKRSELLDFAARCYQELAKKYAKVDVLGLSLGGLLAYYLSQQFNPNHLFLLAPAFNLHLNIPQILPLITLLKGLGFTHLRSAAGNLFNRDHYEIAYRQLPLNTIGEILRLIHEFEFLPTNIATTIFLGRHDRVVNSAKLALRLEKLPNKKLIWLNQSAHVLPLDNDLTLIISSILSTFNSPINRA